MIDSLRNTYVPTLLPPSLSLSVAPRSGFLPHAHVDARERRAGTRMAPPWGRVKKGAPWTRREGGEEGRARKRACTCVHPRRPPHAATKYERARGGEALDVYDKYEIPFSRLRPTELCLGRS